MQIPLMEGNGEFFHQQLDLYHFLENYKYVFDHYGTDRFNQVILKVQDLNSQWEVVKNEDIDEDFAKQVLLINAELDIISSELRLFLPYKFWEKKPLEIELTKEIKDLLANSHFPAEIREINHKLKKIYFKHEQLKISLNTFAKKYNIEKILNQLENQKETLYKHIGWMENVFLEIKSPTIWKLLCLVVWFVSVQEGLTQSTCSQGSEKPGEEWRQMCMKW